jgi:hypothetical protein
MTKGIILLALVRVGLGVICKDNAMYASKCGTVDCNSSVGKIMCPDSCGLCEKFTKFQTGCRDQGQHCSVMNCAQQSARIICAKTCGVCDDKPTTSGASSSSSGALSTAGQSNQSKTPVSYNSCSDNSAMCSTAICKWSNAKTLCRKTCDPSCQIRTTRKPYTRPPRPTKPPRATKPPKIPNSIASKSPCQDNVQFKSMCGKGYLKCDKLAATMYCPRTCGQCAKIDAMFICKDAKPELCEFVNCDNMIAKQYCQKSCNACLSMSALTSVSQLVFPISVCLFVCLFYYELIEIPDLEIRQEANRLSRPGRRLHDRPKQPNCLSGLTVIKQKRQQLKESNRRKLQQQGGQLLEHDPGLLCVLNLLCGRP